MLLKIQDIEKQQNKERRNLTKEIGNNKLTLDDIKRDKFDFEEIKKLVSADNSFRVLHKYRQKILSLD